MCTSGSLQHRLVFDWSTPEYCGRRSKLGALRGGKPTDCPAALEVDAAYDRWAGDPAVVEAASQSLKWARASREGNPVVAIGCLLSALVGVVGIILTGDPVSSRASWSLGSWAWYPTPVTTAGRSVGVPLGRLCARSLQN